MDYIDVDGPCENCGTTNEASHIRIRPNYRMFKLGHKPDFARQCSYCFELVFGGYGTKAF